MPARAEQSTVSVNVKGHWRPATRNQHRAFETRNEQKEYGLWNILGEEGDWEIVNRDRSERYPIASSGDVGLKSAPWSTERAKAFVDLCKLALRIDRLAIPPDNSYEPIMDYLTSGGVLRNRAKYEEVAEFYEREIVDAGLGAMWVSGIRFSNGDAANYKAYPDLAMGMLVDAERSLRAMVHHNGVSADATSDQSASSSNRATNKRRRSPSTASGEGLRKRKDGGRAHKRRRLHLSTLHAFAEAQR